jgi:hypothetical protein
MYKSYQYSRATTYDNSKMTIGTEQWENNTTQTSYTVLRKIEPLPRGWKACD